MKMSSEAAKEGAQRPFELSDSSKSEAFAFRAREKPIGQVVDRQPQLAHS